MSMRTQLVGPCFVWVCLKGNSSDSLNIQSLFYVKLVNEDQVRNGVVMCVINGFNT